MFLWHNKSIFIYLFCFTTILSAQDLSIFANADIVSRYIWRGINVNDAANIQPALTFSVSGFSIGMWGSYCLSHNLLNNSLEHELDSWCSYTYALENGMNFGLILTDYYFPNAGIKWGNFNNYNNPKGAGAHTIEPGFFIKLSNSLPLLFSGFINVHNDAGNNTYFQVDYSTFVSEFPLTIFLGAAGGSKKNPNFYQTEKFNVTNVGIKATKSIKITDEYSLPVYVTFLINPRTEISYLVFGLTF